MGIDNPLLNETPDFMRLTPPRAPRRLGSEGKGVPFMDYFLGDDEGAAFCIPVALLSMHCMEKNVQHKPHRYEGPKWSRQQR